MLVELASGGLLKEAEGPGFKFQGRGVARLEVLRSGSGAGGWKYLVGVYPLLKLVHNVGSYACGQADEEHTGKDLQDGSFGQVQAGQLVRLELGEGSFGGGGLTRRERGSSPARNRNSRTPAGRGASDTGSLRNNQMTLRNWLDMELPSFGPPRLP